MKDNPVLDKSFAFALRIVKLCKYLIDEKREFVLSKELLVSGTHVGRHVKEAINAESKDLFTREMGIAKRKASETEYWLELLFQSDLLSLKQFESMQKDCEEIIKLLTSIFKTSTNNNV